MNSPYLNLFSTQNCFFSFFSLKFSAEFPLSLLCYTLPASPLVCPNIVHPDPLQMSVKCCEVLQCCTTPCMLYTQLTWLKHNWRKCTYSYSQYNTYNNRVNHHNKPTSANTTIRVSQGQGHWLISISQFCEPSTGVWKVFKDPFWSKEEDSRWSG